MSTDVENKIYRTHNEILGSFSKCITAQSPTIKDISPALKELQFILSERRGELGVTDFESEQELSDFVKLMVYDIKPIADLNISEFAKNGGKQPEFAFISRYDTLKPEHDFVDLDALTRNITNDLLRP